MPMFKVQRMNAQTGQMEIVEEMFAGGGTDIPAHYDQVPNGQPTETEIDRIVGRRPTQPIARAVFNTKTNKYDKTPLKANVPINGIHSMPVMPFDVKTAKAINRGETVPQLSLIADADTTKVECLKLFEELVAGGAISPMFMTAYDKVTVLMLKLREELTIPQVTEEQESEPEQQIDETQEQELPAWIGKPTTSKTPLKQATLRQSQLEPARRIVQETKKQAVTVKPKPVINRNKVRSLIKKEPQ